MFDPFISFTSNNSSNSTSNNTKYTIKKQIDLKGNMYYQLIEVIGNLETPKGEHIVFSTQDLKFDKDNNLEQIINSLIREKEKINKNLALIQSQLNNTVKLINFEDLNIDTNEKDLDTIINELDNKNIPENIIINGILYKDALPKDTELYLEDAAVQVIIVNDNNGNRYYKFVATSDKSAPYNWTAIYKNNEPIMEWTPAYDGTAGDINDLKNQILNHINNKDIHVSLKEKNFWNEKVSVLAEEEDECLTFYNN